MKPRLGKVWDGTNQNESRRLSRNVHRTGLHLPRMELESKDHWGRLARRDRAVHSGYLILSRGHAEWPCLAPASHYSSPFSCAIGLPNTS